MITLQDYLGYLISSITSARVLSDLQTVRVAEAYAANSLLQHFPVPRMRLNSVEMTIPISVDETPVVESLDSEPIDIRNLAETLYLTIKKTLHIKRLHAETSGPLKTALDKEAKKLEQELRVSFSDTALTDFSKTVSALTMEILSRTSRGDLRRLIQGERAQAVQEEIAQRLKEALMDVITPRPSKEALELLLVTVESDKLREKRPESLVYIKLSISEEGVEWHRIEQSDGQVVSKLLPE